MLICFCCSCRENKSEFKNLSSSETIHCELEVCLEYSIRYKDARRENCGNAVCCFRFGGLWKMTNFICRSKIFSNMSSVCTIFFFFENKFLDLKFLLYLKCQSSSSTIFVKYLLESIISITNFRCTWNSNHNQSQTF